MNPKEHEVTQDQQHPGDVYTKAQIEAWYSWNLAAAHRQLARATAAASAALGGKGSARDAQRALGWATKELAEYEAGYAQWQAEGTMPWQHIETFHRVAGSAGTLADAFVPVTVSPGEAAALELGLDPALEPGAAGPDPYVLASREYHARQAVCHDAMRRWGWWQPGDEPTAEMRAQWDATDDAEAGERDESG
jgi:hypothetical protein